MGIIIYTYYHIVVNGIAVKEMVIKYENVNIYIYYNANNIHNLLYTFTDACSKNVLVQALV